MITGYHHHDLTCLTRRNPSFSKGNGAIMSEKGKSVKNTLNLDKFVHFEMLDIGDIKWTKEV